MAFSPNRPGGIRVFLLWRYTGIPSEVLNGGLEVLAERNRKICSDIENEIFQGCFNV